MRKEMVDQREGMSQMKVKVHMDDMKRATIREQNYFYSNISNTPFTLGLAFPAKYGQFRVKGGTELTRKGGDGECHLTSHVPHCHLTPIVTVLNLPGFSDENSANPARQGDRSRRIKVGAK